MLNRYHIFRKLEKPLPDTGRHNHRQSRDKALKRERIDRTGETDLYEAILALQTPEEARSFFNDLCTPAELEGLIDRWRVAQMLVKKVPYRKIAAETNVSTATIVRVARFLNNGNDGYKTIMQRQGKL